MTPGIPLQAPRPPRNWQDFEDLCRDLWAEIWRDPDTAKNGRSGFEQDGVDLFGRPDRGDRYAGLQCKLKDRLSGGKLRRKVIEEEVEKAKSFEPKLSEYGIATTALRDPAAQGAAREITDRQVRNGSFPVTVYSWEDIWERLQKHPRVLLEHYPEVDPTRLTLRQDYLEALAGKMLPVPLVDAGTDDDELAKVELPEVYTALDVSEEILLVNRPGEEALGEKRNQGAGTEAAVGERLRADAAMLEAVVARVRDELGGETLEAGGQREGRGRRLTALEASAIAPRLVLVGAPGSGKSTFARYLNLCLAGELLGRSDANLATLNGTESGDAAPWPHGALFPVFVNLHAFVRSDQFPREGEPSAEHLYDYLDEEWRNAGEGVGRMIRQEITSEEARAILILDGLDETPDARATRVRLKQVIASFCLLHRQCRVLVTSRPYAYRPSSKWRLDDQEFGESWLAELDEARIAEFADSWYQRLAKTRQLSGLPSVRAKSLCRTIAESGWLQPLAERPLMLTMLCNLHSRHDEQEQGGFGRRRADLYEGSVQLLFDQWNRAKGLRQEGREGAVAGRGLTFAELHGLPDRKVRLALEALAFELHGTRSSSRRGEVGIEPGDLYKKLEDLRDPEEEPVVDVGEIGRYLQRRAGILDDDLQRRSGLLAEQRQEFYQFPHLSYEEYLAACYGRERPKELLYKVRAQPDRWGEVVLLTANLLAEEQHRFWELLEGLVPEPPPPSLERDDPRFGLAFLAAKAAHELGVSPADHPRKLGLVRSWLEATLATGALSTVERSEAGRILGTLEDRRPGVGLDESGLPAIEWVNILAGAFLMGSAEGEEGSYPDEQPQHEVKLPAYRLSRYPVTNAQYRAFVDDGGYSEKWRECWTEAGWKWKGEREGPDDELPARFLLDNHPRVNVTWYEALAFSQWLGERRRLDLQIRLPSEAEWERAARGPEGWRYPWGDQFEQDRCNNSYAGLGGTTAVGSFPGGRSVEGVDDLSGNVLEWCCSKWRKDYKKSPEEDLEGTSSRVVRGGSFSNFRGYVRCAYRLRNVPVDRVRNIGFRLSAPI